MTYALKEFNTGQVTLPKAWREKYKTKHYLAFETKEWLLIKPIEEEQDDDKYDLELPKKSDCVVYEEDDECVYYETKDWYVWLHFKNGIEAWKLIKRMEKAIKTKK